ncbi:carboxymuconolactone decarboxylase family protein [Epibacterium ulvae]|uniref:carboxymuconolactone decarboxylase family protein n=1 Tax=Epibacterium ulvae TaxID=1156985 RepID=UPI00248F680D|nr:carboxymuconolactone decarboxylase family protein [Epibacterium ulvae]
MTPRLDFHAAAPEAVKAIFAVETFLTQSTDVTPHDLHLLKLRASQINGCAYCVDMHTKEARKDQIPEQKIALICVWRESSLFSEKERALLAWTEAMTQISQGCPSDESYEAMRAHYSDAALVSLSVAITQINVWNRLAVGFRAPHPTDT